MSQAAVQLQVAGQTYRVVTSAAAEDLQRLADAVEDWMYAATPAGRKPSQQALVLAAITLAHELEEEVERRRRLEARYRHVLENLLGRVDAVLDEVDLPAEAPARSRAAADLDSIDTSDL